MGRTGGRCIISVMTALHFFPIKCYRANPCSSSGNLPWHVPKCACMPSCNSNLSTYECVAPVGFLSCHQCGQKAWNAWLKSEWWVYTNTVSTWDTVNTMRHPERPWDIKFNLLNLKALSRSSAFGRLRSMFRTIPTSQFNMIIIQIRIIYHTLSIFGWSQIIDLLESDHTCI